MYQLFRSPLLWLLVVYYAVSAVTLLVWDSRGVYSPTGDEPHYLVISDALWVDRTTDVTAAYQREIDQPRWYPLGLAEPGSPLQPPAAHVVPTAEGFHSWHGIGVGAFVAMPTQVLGINGARWAMVAFSSLGVVLAWFLAGQFLTSMRSRVGASAAVAIAFPLLLAGTQIYPDIPAGILLLAVFTWWLVPRARTRTGWTALAGIAASLVPWLGSRFILVGTIAVVALVLVNLRKGKQLVAALVPAVVSAIGLIGYHLGAFGNLLGPPTEGVVEFGTEFLLLLPGLLLDQNQGLLWGNPVLWAALPGVVLLWGRSRPLAAMWLLWFLSLWIPAAAHPGLYGLGSFNGRYSWALAVLAFLPALATLGALARRTPRVFWAVVSLGIAFQAYLVALSVFIAGGSPGSPAGLDLYSRPLGTWLESYSAWWFPIQGLLPAWYDPAWAFGYPQNWVWLVIALVVAGGAVLRWHRTYVGTFFGLAAVAVVAAALVGKPGDRSLVQVNDVTVVVGQDSPGYPVIGPAQLMRLGTYVWSIDYETRTPLLAGKWELVRAMDEVLMASGELPGTDGESKTLEIPIRIRDLQPRDYYLRVGWYGESDAVISRTGVRYG